MQIDDIYQIFKTNPQVSSDTKPTMNIQYFGYLEISNEKVKVLVRDTKTTRFLKIRRSGADDAFLSDESIFLGEPENRHLLDKLFDNAVIKI